MRFLSLLLLLVVPSDQFSHILPQHHRVRLSHLHAEVESSEAPASERKKDWPVRMFQDISDMSFIRENGLMPERGEDYRCGYISLVGAPNMGKSTLLNAVIQEDLCVITQRPQTTRHAIIGLLTSDVCQLCLIDTPGVIAEPSYKLQEGMMQAVVRSIDDADVFLIVTDLLSTPIPDDKLFARVQNTTKPIIVAINKIDLIDVINPEANQAEGRTTTVEEAVARWRMLVPQALAIIPLAAGEGMENKGVVALRKLLVGGPDVPAAIRDLGRPIAGMFKPGVKTIKDEEAKEILPLSPALYEEDYLTNRDERFFASEIVRGALFKLLKKEVPYCCEVRIKNFRDPRPEDKKKLVRIEALILVDRTSHKPIVIGKDGATIKQVGSLARDQLEEFLRSQVHLDLKVEVEKNWRKDKKLLKKFGYLTPW